MEQIVADGADTAKEELIRYVDKIVTTPNPAILPDGSNTDDTPTPSHLQQALRQDRGFQPRLG